MFHPLDYCESWNFKKGFKHKARTNTARGGSAGICFTAAVSLHLLSPDFPLKHSDCIVETRKCKVLREIPQGSLWRSSANHRKRFWTGCSASMVSLGNTKERCLLFQCPISFYSFFFHHQSFSEQWGTLPRQVLPECRALSATVLCYHSFSHRYFVLSTRTRFVVCLVV